MLENARAWLESKGVGEQVADIVLRVGGGVLVLVVAYLVGVIARRLLMRGIERLVKVSSTHWDDILLRHGFFDRVTRLVPALVVQLLATIPLAGYPTAIEVVRTAVHIYLLVLTIFIVDSFLNGALEIYRTYEISRRFYLKGLFQVAKIATYFIVGVIIVSMVVDRSPVVFFSGLGAMTAVLLLIFKDSILGFVAGIQLTANNMVRRGDWIAMPKFGADGDVLDITLTTVKVQNWDKTITTVPTYALISDAFKNWRGMEESGGRRIKRSLSIDMTTIRICDAEMVQRFRRFAHISGYIDQKERELAEWNTEHGVDTGELINGRHMTNVGTFRTYVVEYLRHHPEIRQDMTFLVRQLPPTEKGLPIEIYVFSKDQRWVQYEGIQADIFDHIIAVVPEFELRVFQYPTGVDVSGLELGDAGPRMQT